MKLSRKIGLASLVLVGLALILSLGESADAQGKNAKAAHNLPASLDLCMTKLKEAEQALFAAGSTGSGQNVIQPAVLQNLQLSIKYIQAAYNHAAAAKAADNPALDVKGKGKGK